MQKCIQVAWESAQIWLQKRLQYHLVNNQATELQSKCIGLAFLREE
jgi:diphthamide synthase (EF-2-diphthine--ammonia ligase)